MSPRPLIIEPFSPPSPDTARERAFILGLVVGALSVATAALMAFLVL